MSRIQRCDVLVVGGGPAGTSTAIGLARSGRSVVLVERSVYEKPRIGETLPPDIKTPLIDLGVWSAFKADGHLVSSGVKAYWGHPEPIYYDYISTPYGHGWHIDRSAFDRTLALHATSMGVLVKTGIALAVHPTRIQGRLDVNWHAPLGDESRVEARFLVDATGRAASISRRLGAKQIVHDHLIALTRYAVTPDASLDACRMTHVESSKNGWWYFAQIPENKSIMMFLTDERLLPNTRSARERFWSQELSHSYHARRWLGTTSHFLPLSVHRACSTQLDRKFGDAWLAVGDSAMSFDPLTSQGILCSLLMGHHAARTIDGWLNGHNESLLEYDKYLSIGYSKYLATRREHYAKEQRWKEAPFWKNNSTAVVSPKQAQISPNERTNHADSHFQAVYHI